MKLRAFQESDWPRAAELLTSREVAKTYMLPEFASVEEARPLFERLKQLSEDDRRFVRAMEADDGFVGFVNDVEMTEDSVEVGYAVHPACWGRGYATAALNLAIEALFDRGFAEVAAGAFADNAASLRVMEKCGMTEIAKRDRIEYRGVTYECVYRVIRKLPRPKMVIFDAGRTLIDYTDMETLEDYRAIMPYITKNPRNLTAGEINDFAWEVFGRFDEARKHLFEVHEQTILGLVFDLLGLEFSIPVREVEAMIWRSHPGIVAVDGAAEMLAALNELGMETAVISNLDFSGYLLEERLKISFPHNRFRFVLASSDCGIRKPDPLIFRAGIVRSGHAPGEIWYVGDKEKVDAAGSRAAGMVPVLYKSKRNHYDAVPVDTIVLEDWGQLAALLKKLK